MAVTRHICNEFKRYLGNLTATSTVATALGTTLTFGSNLFIDVEPAIATQLVTVISLPGAPPSLEGERQESNVQIRVKAKTVQKSVETTQALINKLHNNTNVCASSAGKVYAEQSSPFIIGHQEGGNYTITVSNYTIKHVKL